MNFKTLLAIGLTIGLTGVQTIARAETSLGAVSDGDLRDAGIQQAQALRQLPDKLRDQGIELTPDQEALIDAKADDLAVQSSQPDFRHKVESTMKKAGIKTLKILGYSGTVIFGASLAPPEFVAFFIEGLFTGHNVNELDKISDYDGGGILEATGAGYLVVDYLFYVAAGAAAIGVASGSIADLIVSAIVCRGHNGDEDHSELGNYCHTNWDILGKIFGGTAAAALNSGADVHHGIGRFFRAVGHYIKKSFEDSPTPATDAVPAPTGPDAN